MPTPNQLYVKREDVHVGQKELLEVHDGTKTEAGFRENIRVGVQYIEAWLRGRGAVPIYNLMEDAATAEISRSQIWQWLKFGAKPRRRPEGDEAPSSSDASRRKWRASPRKWAARPSTRAASARRSRIFRKMSTSPRFETFLTLPAYKKIV